MACKEVRGSIPRSSTKFRMTMTSFTHIGVIAQLGERLHGMQEVRGSMPRSSTIWRATALPVAFFRFARDPSSFLFVVTGKGPATGYLLMRWAFVFQMVHAGSASAVTTSPDQRQQRQQQDAHGAATPLLASLSLRSTMIGSWSGALKGLSDLIGSPGAALPYSNRLLSKG